MSRRRSARVIAALSTVAVAALAPSGSVAAHPLGNFSVSHLSRITLEADHIVVQVAIDAAEIPTAQDRPRVDDDGDDDASPGELAAHADRECRSFAAAATLQLNGADLNMVVLDAVFDYATGQAGLDTSRLDCEFRAAVPSGFGDEVAAVDFVDDYRPGRVGWHEINAVGVGVGLIDSPVPATSVTNDLRSYPEDLLESPLDVREVSLQIGPGGITEQPAAVGVSDRAIAADARDSLVAARPGFLGGFVDRVQGEFENVIGRDDLTLGVGLLAVGLSLVLGASHALLPGHGKTVMAAYIAGRQGQVRDAVLVGATVTFTHTGGVLLLGLALTVSSALAGDAVLGWLGVSSGVLIAALGIALLVSAVRRRDSGWFGHGHHHGPGGHTHDHGNHHTHELHGHDEQHGHGDGHGHGHDGTHDDHDHGAHHLHDHQHDGHHDHDHEEPKVSRGGLVGMGVAGGLVPSPSALIVLLSAIALGRTWFGVVLVIGYGVGMAGVLTVAGIALVRVRDSLQRRVDNADGKIARTAQRWGRLAPMLTAGLVFVVGAGLAIRSFTVL